MRLRVGMYVRLVENQGIKRIKKINRKGVCLVLDKKIEGGTIVAFPECVLKASYNIIDLIEVGDYVNDYLVTTGNQNVSSIYIDKLDETGKRTKLYNKDIKSVVTKEQIESMKYEV